MSFKELVEKSKNGDMEGYEALFEQLVDRLWGYALSRLGSEELAEDAVQETFVELWEALPRFTYQGEPQFLGYVYTILKRKVAWQYRDSMVHATSAIDDHAEETAQMPVLAADHTYLALLLERLSETYQEIIHLRYWGQFSFAEIGAALDMDENTAKVAHHRALKRLQELHIHHEQRIGA